MKALIFIVASLKLLTGPPASGQPVFQTQVIGNLAQTNLPAAVSSATYDASNELTAWNGSAITYDANGSTLTDVNGRQYTWDARNHLTSISGGASGSFTYDPWGRRVTATAGGQTTAYFYDGANKVSETTATGTATLLPGGIDEYFQRTDSSGVTVPLADELGSSLAMASSSGSLLTQYTYDPYGSTTISGSASGNSSEYTGRESDATGLYYYRARYYNPGTGRFLSEDPIGFRGGVNKYAYAFGSPTNLIDPSGLTPESNASFLAQWLLGIGPRNREYDDWSYEGFEMRYSRAAEMMRDTFQNNNCQNTPNINYSTPQAAWDTVVNPATADWGDTSAEVGGFANASVVNNGDGTATYTIPNTAGAHSFFII